MAVIPKPSTVAVMRHLVLVTIAILLTYNPASAVTSTDVDRLNKMVEAGKFQEALNLSQALIQKRGKDPDVRLIHARVLESTGATEKAIEEFRKTLDLDPKRVDAMVQLSNIYLQNLDFEHATSYARQAVSLAPHSVPARLALVSAYMQTDRLVEADWALSQMLRDEPNNADALYLAYEIQSRKGDSAQARKYLQDAVRLKPCQAAWKMELCNLLENSGQADIARKYFNEILEDNPQANETRLRLARNMEVYQRDYDGAMAQYKRVLQLDPNSAAAITGIDRCNEKDNNLALRLKLELHSWLKGRR